MIYGYELLIRYIFEFDYERVLANLKESNIIRVYLWPKPPNDTVKFVQISCRLPIRREDVGGYYWVSNSTRRRIIKEISHF
jgi:hypothetical protein